jgi:hypothetical protein
LTDQPPLPQITEYSRSSEHGGDQMKNEKSMGTQPRTSIPRSDARFFGGEFSEGLLGWGGGFGCRLDGWMHGDGTGGWGGSAWMDVTLPLLVPA